jgi:signal transduction histidine kinase
MKKKATRRDPAALQSAAHRAQDAAIDPEVRALLHELQVHSEEITVQNEQLVKTQIDLELARDRYADLYDFAPVGYISLDPHGSILEVNLQGTSLLGRHRRFLIGVPLTGLLDHGSRDRLFEFLARVVADHPAPTPEVEVHTREPRRALRLIGRLQAEAASARRQIFIAMLDVTEEHRLASERAKFYETERARALELANEVEVRLAAEERIRVLLDRLVHVQERERQRLALNLHDQLGQQLTALKLTVGAIKEGTWAGPELEERLERVVVMLDHIDRDVDYLAWELRPAALDQEGLEPALGAFLRQWSSMRGIAADFHAAPAEGPRLPPEIESHLYRIAQEALNNVAKHARATHVSVLFERRRLEARLIIEDDGCGFAAEAAHTRAFQSGLGMTGMRERAAAMGGAVHVESSPGKGTTVFVRVPARAVPAGA